MHMVCFGIRSENIEIIFGNYNTSKGLCKKYHMNLEYYNMSSAHGITQSIWLYLDKPLYIIYNNIASS